MSQITINIGAAANDGTGDPLRTAFNDVNLNFNEVYAAGPVLSNIQIANNSILTTNTNGNLVLAPNGTGVVQSNVSILPNLANIRNLGSATQRWATVYTQYLDVSGNLNITGNVIYNGDLNVAGNLTVQGNIIQVGNIVTETLTIQLANAASTANAANGSGITVGANDNIATLLYNSTGNVWTTNIGLSSVGNITAPYFFGNGSQLTGVTASGVAAAALTGNTLSPNVLFSSLTSVGTLANLSVSGNVTGGNLLTGGLISATGNITGNYFVGNGSQLTGLAATYGNANAVAYGESGWAGNIVPSGNAVYSLGNATNQWNDLYVSNATIFMNNVPISLSAGNVLTVNGNAVLTNGSNTAVSTTGNITAGNVLTGGIVSATGNITGGNILGGANVNATTHTGTTVSVTGTITGGNLATGGIVSATGNITGGNINSPTLNNSGNISVVASGNTWTFGSTGNLTVPATNSVPARISTQTTLANEKGFDLRITAGNTDGCTVPGGDMYLSAGVGYNGISHGAGNVNIVTGDRYGNVNGNIWRFDSSGGLTLPLGSATIKNTAGNALAFGLNAGLTSQGANAVAIGINSGVYSQSTNAVAVGTLAGNGGRVTTNYVSGAVSPSTTLVVTSTTGIVPGMVITGTGFFGTITVVTVTNSTTLEISASAVFTPSGELNFTGSQGDNSVAIGTQAGQVQQGQFAVAIGDNAGSSGQGTDAVAIGASAGLNTQGAGAVAFGQGTGETSQGANAVAIGKAAGQVNQGINSIAIGQSAGLTNQGNNSIVLNATGSALEQTTANTFTVAPVRNDVANTAEVMFYNTTSKEITYGNVISVAGNVSAGNLNVTGNIVDSGALTIITGSNGNIALAPNGTGIVTASGNISAVGNVTGGNILTGGLTSTASLSITGNTATVTTANYAIGYRDIPQVSLASNVTTALTDAGKHYYSTSASNLALTIANNTSVTWPVGTAISIVNRGTANITIAGDTGVSLYLAGNSTAGNRTVTTYGMATVMNVAANIWMISGTVV